MYLCNTGVRPGKTSQSRWFKGELYQTFPTHFAKLL